MTAAELKFRTRRWRAARDLEEQLRPGRDQAVREAVAAGLTHRAIADAVGFSDGLVTLILNKETPKP
jgi:FixJ family two-component response regulator